MSNFYSHIENLRSIDYPLIDGANPLNHVHKETPEGLQKDDEDRRAGKGGHHDRQIRAVDHGRDGADRLGKMGLPAMWGWTLTS
jgi:hypothetical protein